ncbi:MAG: hypothetical protein V9G14_05545 [Cypionkella sp.]
MACSVGGESQGVLVGNDVAAMGIEANAARCSTWDQGTDDQMLGVGFEANQGDAVGIGAQAGGFLEQGFPGHGAHLHLRVGNTLTGCGVDDAQDEFVGGHRRLDRTAKETSRDDRQIVPAPVH